MVGGGGVASQFVSPAGATSHVIEDFENVDLDTDYQFDRGEAGASIVTSPTYEGSGALRITGEATEMISTAARSNRPGAGDTFSYRFQSDASGVANLLYGLQGHDNGYFVQLDFPDGYFKIAYVLNGVSGTINKAENVPFSTGTWYEVVVGWGTDGTHTATLYDDAGNQVVQTSATDSTWTDGVIGFDGYYPGGGAGYYDYVTLQNRVGVDRLRPRSSPFS